MMKQMLNYSARCRKLELGGNRNPRTRNLHAVGSLFLIGIFGTIDPALAANVPVGCVPFTLFLDMADQVFTGCVPNVDPISVLKQDPFQAHRVIKQTAGGNPDLDNLHLRGISIKHFIRVHEEVWALWNVPGTNRWYRSRYNFSTVLCHGSRLDGHILGPVEASDRWDAQAKLDSATPVNKLNRSEWDVSFCPSREKVDEFDRRLSHLTAPIFHQIMWPTTIQDRLKQPSERRFVNYCILGVGKKHGNCRSFATHIKWCLGLKKHKIQETKQCCISNQTSDFHSLGNTPTLCLCRDGRFTFKIGSDNFAGFANDMSRRIHTRVYSANPMIPADLPPPVYTAPPPTDAPPAYTAPAGSEKGDEKNEKATALETELTDECEVELS